MLNDVSEKFPIAIQNGVSYIYDRPEANIVLIFSHGSGGDLTHRQKMRDLFSLTNYGFVIYDYYGYGASQDIPTLLMNEAALTRAIEEMASLTRGKKIILLGASLGCFPTCWLAAQRSENLLGAVLCVPFDRLASFSRWAEPIPGCASLISKLAPYLLGSYDNVALCQQIEVPTLVVRADHDQTIPEGSADRIMSALGKTGHLVTVPTNHQDYLTEELKGEIVSFIECLEEKEMSKTRSSKAGSEDSS